MNNLDKNDLEYIRREYVITSKYTNKKVIFKHKKLIEREQKEHEKIKEKRGY